MEQLLLTFAGKPGANYTDVFFFSLRVNDNHYSTADLSDGYESVLGFSMVRIEDFQVIFAGLEESLYLCERHAMLFLVASVLRIVPFEFHHLNCRSTTQ
jgi:hypothetical protein